MRLAGYFVPSLVILDFIKVMVVSRVWLSGIIMFAEPDKIQRQQIAIICGIIRHAVVKKIGTSIFNKSPSKRAKNVVRALLYRPAVCIKIIELFGGSGLSVVKRSIFG